MLTALNYLIAIRVRYGFSFPSCTEMSLTVFIFPNGRIIHRRHHFEQKCQLRRCLRYLLRGQGFSWLKRGPGGLAAIGLFAAWGFSTLLLLAASRLSLAGGS